MSEWEALSAQTQEVYRRLATRDREEIRRIRSGLIRKAMRESIAAGYVEGAPHAWLSYEYERRKTRWVRSAYIAALLAALLWVYQSILG